MRRGLSFAIAGTFVLATACTQTAPPSPTARPTEPAKPAPAAPTAPAPTAVVAASKPTEAAKPAAQAAAKPAEDWAQVVEAAKREGKVSVWGPAAAQTRDGLTTEFEKRNPGITVEYDSGASSQLPPKLSAERAAGLYKLDVIIQGTTTSLTNLKPTGALTSMRPYLTGPSTQDLTKWWRGNLSFADTAGEYALTFSGYVKAPFSYNTEMVKADEIKSYRDLLDPKWKGKIAFFDPRLSGGGGSVVAYWYLTPGLGKEFVRDFFQKQEVALSRDDRQLLDWVARGEYPIGFGAGDAQTIDLIRKGLPIKAVDPNSLREPPYLTAGTGNVVVVDRAPHPNATKVYLDYLLSRDGQYEWSKATGFASYRLDVPRDHVESFLIPKDGVTYLEQHTEPVLKYSAEIDDFLKSILPPA